MKKFYFFISFICISFFANAQYDHQNIEFVGNWYDSTQVAEPSLGIKYNGVWGWVNPKNNVEYAIIGSGKGTSVIDLSNPVSPKRVAFVKGRRERCVWREYKTYKNYLYTISDDDAPNSFQIIDLSYLPDSVHVVYDGTDLFERAHTLYIDGDKLHVAGVTKNAVNQGTYPMATFSLANPEKPTLLRTLNQDISNLYYIHDMFVRNDTIYASAANLGLYIFFYDKTINKYSQLNVLGSYPNQGYNHSSALTTNGKTLIFCDEDKDFTVKVVDVSDINNLTIASSFKSNDGPVPHNPYINSNSHVVISYHQDGLQIFDIRDPKHPFKTGYFDTDTIDGKKNNYDPKGYGIHGNWGAYIDLPSGRLLASDMQNGLYVLDATEALGITENKTNLILLTVFPNPATDELTLKFNLITAERISCEVFDAMGRKLLSTTKDEAPGIVQEIIPLTTLAKGMYSIKIAGKGTYGTIKFLKN
jgi:choice-of-anchor B domain-containing protein